MRKALALAALVLVLAGCGKATAPSAPQGDPRVQDYGTHAPIVYRVCYYYPDNFETTCIVQKDRASADSINPGQMRTITYTVSATYVDVYFQMSR
jgi:hypothetical protein